MSFYSEFIHLSTRLKHGSLLVKDQSVRRVCIFFREIRGLICMEYNDHTMINCHIGHVPNYLLNNVNIIIGLNRRWLDSV
jgi:hypothetical protein